MGSLGKSKKKKKKEEEEEDKEEEEARYVENPKGRPRQKLGPKKRKKR